MSDIGVQDTNYMKVWRTVTGMTLADAVNELMAVLPPEAYKPVPGGADLTDIDPSYLTQVATKVFGLVGVGWTYNYDPQGIILEKDERQSGSGRIRTVCTATVPFLTVKYRFVDEDGNISWSAEIPANGGSENENQGFALRGALTNAIGAAFAKMCWQLLVYQGKVDHKNADKAFNAQRKKAAEKQAQAVAEQASVEYFGLAAPPKPEDPAEALEWARSLVIPQNIGVPLAGKTLGEASKEQIGIHILKFLSGRIPNAKQVIFTPEDEYQRALQDAAIILLDSRDNGRSK